MERPVVVQWLNNPIPAKEFRAVMRRVLRGGYAPITQAELASLSRVAPSMSESQIISARKTILRLKRLQCIRRGPPHKLLQRWRSGETVMALARAYDYPPMVIVDFLREAMRGGDRHDVLRLDRETAPARDADEVISEREIAATAQRNEDLFVNYLRGLGLTLQTQCELAEEQKRMYGRAVITPDVLFPEPITILGAPVRWIDFKSYFGCKLPHIHAGNLEQSARYYAKWGPGAICYQYGFTDDLEFPGTTLLDGTYLGRLWD